MTFPTTNYKLSVRDPNFLPHVGCDLEFTLNLGDGVVIVGENGIGKTTLFHRLQSQLSETKVLIEQKSLDFFYDRTLADVRRILFEARGEFIDYEMFEELWNRLGLAQKSDRFLSTLSGGEIQALKLVCGLAQQVPFYFLDEPSQFLDNHRKHILGEFLDVLRLEGKTVLVIEHDLSWIPKGWSVHQLHLDNQLIKRARIWIT